jgi:hypothetical protein
MIRPCLNLVAFSLLANCAQAQVIQQQTVQLPTFHYFGVQTTVVVPTRGTIPLGSVTRGGQMRTRFDKVGSSLGARNDIGGMSMGVTVIDNAEIDRQLLAEAARRRGAKVDVLGRPVPDEIQLDPPPLNSTILDRPREKVGGAVYLRRGRDAELGRQPEVAKVFYRRAAKLGNAVEKRTAEERLAVLEDAKRK